MQAAYSIGPQGNAVAKYGSNAAAYEATLSRLKAWGFNTIGPLSTVDAQPWQRTLKLPTIYVVRPGGYGLWANEHPEQVGTLYQGQNIKELANGNSPFFVNVTKNGMPDWGDLTRLGEALTFQLTKTGPTAPGGIADAINGNLNLDYLIGIAVDDSDQTWAYFTSVQYNPFDTNPSETGAAYGGYLTAITSPIQQADIKHDFIYDLDQTVYVKKHWHDFLVAKYGTIGALNTAWGSTYTTFGSSATQVTQAFIGRTDGVAYYYTFRVPSGTLVPNSLRIYQDYTGNTGMIAGDCYHPRWNDLCNPGGGTTKGAVWGPTAPAGTVNYSTGVITVVGGGLWKAPGNIVCVAGTSCTAYYNDGTDPGIVSGDHMTVANSTGGVLDLSNVVASTNSRGSHTFTGAYCSGTDVESDAYIVTWPWSGGDVIGGACDSNVGWTAKITPLAAGHVLTLDYQINGWDSGVRV